MKIIVSTILSFLLFGSVVAQELDFVYGKPVVSPANYEFSRFVGQIKGETFLIKVDKSGVNRVLETYDKGFNLVKSAHIQLDKNQNHDAIIVRDEKIFIIFHVDVKKTKKRLFYIAEIAKNGEVKNDQSKLLVEADIYKSKKQKGHYVSTSKDCKTIIIAARPKLDKKAPEQFDFYTFDENNKQLSKVRVKFNGPTSGFIYHQMLVSSKSNSYLFVEKRTGNSNQPIVQYVLLTINGKKGTYQQEGIDARNTFFQKGKFIELEHRVAYIGYYVDRSKQRISGMYQVSKNGDEKTRKIFYNFLDYPPSILKSEINTNQEGSLFYHGQIVRYITTDGDNITVSSESTGKEEVQTVNYYGSYGYGGGYYGGYHGGYYGWGGMGGYGGYGGYGYGGYGGVSVSTDSYDILGNIHVITFGPEGGVLNNEVVEKKQYTSSPLSGFNIYSDGTNQLIGFQNGDYPKTLVKGENDEYFKTVEDIIINKPTYETEEVFRLKFKPRTTYFIGNGRSLFYYQGEKMHAVGELIIK